MGAPDRPMFLFIYRTGLGMYLTSDECSIATLSALPTLHDADSDGTRPTVSRVRITCGRRRWSAGGSMGGCEGSKGMMSAARRRQRRCGRRARAWSERRRALDEPVAEDAFLRPTGCASVPLGCKKRHVDWRSADKGLVKTHGRFARVTGPLAWRYYGDAARYPGLGLTFVTSKICILDTR